MTSPTYSLTALQADEVRALLLDRPSAWGTLVGSTLTLLDTEVALSELSGRAKELSADSEQEERALQARALGYLVSRLRGQ